MIDFEKLLLKSLTFETFLSQLKIQETIKQNERLTRGDRFCHSLLSAKRIFERISDRLVICLIGVYFPLVNDLALLKFAVSEFDFILSRCRGICAWIVSEIEFK